MTPDVQALTGRVYAALVSGWSAGFLVAAGFLFVAGVIMCSLVSVSKEAAAQALKEGATAS